MKLLVALAWVFVGEVKADSTSAASCPGAIVEGLNQGASFAEIYQGGVVSVVNPIAGIGLAVKGIADTTSAVGSQTHRRDTGKCWAGNSFLAQIAGAYAEGAHGERQALTNAAIADLGDVILTAAIPGGQVPAGLKGVALAATVYTLPERFSEAGNPSEAAK